MLRMLGLRIARAIAVLVAVSLGTFSLIALSPGDPAATILGTTATPAEVAYLDQQLGVNQPWPDRYWHWVTGAVQGNFGLSLVPPRQSVAQMLGQAVPVTAEIVVIALVLGLIFGIALGAWAAHRQDQAADRIITAGSFALISVPAFVLGLLLAILLVFHPTWVRVLVLAAGLVIAGRALSSASQRKPLLVRRPGRGALVLAAVATAIGVLGFLFIPAFPRFGWTPITTSLAGNLRFAFLPALTLTLGLIPLFAQVLRADMVQTLQQNFIVVARAKGMSELHIIFREALRPSLFSLVTVLGLSIGALLAGSVVVENIFGLPGLGSVLLNAITSKNYSVVQAGVLLIALVFLIVNLLVDIAYAYLDPRTRRAAN